MVPTAFLLRKSPNKIMPPKNEQPSTVNCTKEKSANNKKNSPTQYPKTWNLERRLVDNQPMNLEPSGSKAAFPSGFPPWGSKPAAWELPTSPPHRQRASGAHPTVGGGWMVPSMRSNKPKVQGWWCWERLDKCHRCVCVCVCVCYLFIWLALTEKSSLN